MDVTYYFVQCLLVGVKFRPVPSARAPPAKADNGKEEEEKERRKKQQRRVCET